MSASTRKAVAVEERGTYFVTVHTKSGECVFRFDDVVSERGSITAVVEASLPVGGAVASFEQSLSVFNPQSRDSFIRSLKDNFGGEAKWGLALSAAVTAFRASFRKAAADGIVTASDIELTSPSFTLYPFIEHGVANLIYAKGGTGKTYFALDLALSLVTGKSRYGECATVQKILFIDWENSAETYRFRLSKLGYAHDGFTDATLGNFYYKETKGVPLYEMVDELAKFVAEKGIGLVIIDSATGAAGGPPEESAVVTRFFAALRKLCVTTLIIAHEPKGEGKGDTAFGSVFWMNFSRNVWRMVVEVANGLTRTLTLSHIKMNNGPLLNNITVEMSETLAGIGFAVVKKVAEPGLWEHVVALLKQNGEMKAGEIAKAMDVNVQTIRNLLVKMRERKAVKDGSTYPLVRLMTESDL